jgi:hypothetical protein
MFRAVVLPAALLWAATAPMAFAVEGEPAMMRTCVETFEGDPEVTVPLGAFCSCYVAEILRDAEDKPELYGAPKEDQDDDGFGFEDEEDEQRPPKKLYYSSKEEADKVAAVVAAMQGHETYCVRILTE